MKRMTSAVIALVSTMACVSAQANDVTIQPDDLGAVNFFSIPSKSGPERFQCTVSSPISVTAVDLNDTCYRREVSLRTNGYEIYSSAYGGVNRLPYVVNDSNGFELVVTDTSSIDERFCSQASINKAVPI